MYVVLADMFLDLPVRPGLKGHFSDERLGVSDRVFDGDADLQRIGSHTMDALDDMHFVRMRVAVAIDPGGVFQSNRIG